MFVDQNFLCKWYADSLESLLIVLDELRENEHGFAFDYNVIKCYLMIKPEFFQKPNKTFLGLDFVVIEGHRVPGSDIGFDKNCNDFMINVIELI